MNELQLRTQGGEVLGTYRSKEQRAAGEVVPYGKEQFLLLEVSDGKAIVEIAPRLPRPGVGVYIVQAARSMVDRVRRADNHNK